jgi:hypothetical protein
MGRGRRSYCMLEVFYSRRGEYRRIDGMGRGRRSYCMLEVFYSRRGEYRRIDGKGRGRRSLVDVFFLREEGKGG